jgi:hypothetical protein
MATQSSAWDRYLPSTISKNECLLIAIETVLNLRRTKPVNPRNLGSFPFRCAPPDRPPGPMAARPPRFETVSILIATSVGLSASFAQSDLRATPDTPALRHAPAPDQGMMGGSGNDDGRNDPDGGELQSDDGDHAARPVRPRPAAQRVTVPTSPPTSMPAARNRRVIEPGSHMKSLASVTSALNSSGLMRCPA